MITLTAEIELTNTSGVLTSVTISGADKNNISAPISSVLNTVKEPKTPFLLGYSKLGGTDDMIGSVDYFISASDYIVTLNIIGHNVTDLYLIFDTIHNNYPRRIRIESTMYECDSPIFHASRDFDIYGGIRITLYDWEIDEHPHIIQGITTSLDNLVIDSRNQQTITISNTDRSDYEKPSYGLKSNNGSIEIIDNNQKIFNYIKNGLLKDNQKSIIKIVDTVSKNSNTVATMYTKNWHYNAYNNTATVEIADGLTELQDITVDKILIYDQNMYDVYQALMAKTPDKFQTTYFPTSIENELEKITTGFLLWENISLWNAYAQWCQITQCYIRCGADGRIAVWRDV